MDTAAFVLSIVAILAAAASAWYTRDQAHQAREQARQAKRSADIDADRRADEVAAQQRAELEGKRANLRLHVQREDNVDGSIDEGPFVHSIVVTDEGPADGGDVELEIVSAWNTSWAREPASLAANATSESAACRHATARSSGWSTLGTSTTPTSASARCTGATAPAQMFRTLWCPRGRTGCEVVPGGSRSQRRSTADPSNH